MYSDDDIRFVIDEPFEAERLGVLDEEALYLVLERPDGDGWEVYRQRTRGGEGDVSFGTGERSDDHTWD